MTTRVKLYGPRSVEFDFLAGDVHRIKTEPGKTWEETVRKQLYLMFDYMTPLWHQGKIKTELITDEVSCGNEKCAKSKWLAYKIKKILGGNGSIRSMIVKLKDPVHFPCWKTSVELDEAFIRALLDLIDYGFMVECLVKNITAIPILTEEQKQSEPIQLGDLTRKYGDEFNPKHVPKYLKRKGYYLKTEVKLGQENENMIKGFNWGCHPGINDYRYMPYVQPKEHSKLIEQLDFRTNYRFSGELTIDFITKEKISILRSFFSREDPLQDLKQEVANNRISDDVTIKVVESGLILTSHKSILARSSTVLATLLSDKWMDSGRAVVNLFDISDEGAAAFLEFLYQNELGKALKSCKVATELLVLANYLLMDHLTEKIIDLLFAMSEQWIIDDGIDHTIYLFEFLKYSGICVDLESKFFEILSREPKKTLSNK